MLSQRLAPWMPREAEEAFTLTDLAGTRLPTLLMHKLSLSKCYLTLTLILII